MSEIKEWFYFPSAVYNVSKPEFLKPVKKVATEYLKRAYKEQKLDEIYPMYQTENFMNDDRLFEFSKFIGETSWNILSSQGYNMSALNLTFREMWCQEHHQFSSQDEHIHGGYCQISGFYFLDCPEDSMRVIIHDPRSSKVYAGLPETNISEVSFASNHINFLPVAGDIMFTNSWLPHSFTKNRSKKPFRFIHFNLAAVDAVSSSCEMPDGAEVI